MKLRVLIEINVSDQAEAALIAQKLQNGLTTLSAETIREMMDDGQIEAKLSAEVINETPTLTQEKR